MILATSCLLSLLTLASVLDGLQMLCSLVVFAIALVNFVVAAVAFHDVCPLVLLSSLRLGIASVALLVQFACPLGLKCKTHDIF